MRQRATDLEWPEHKTTEWLYLMLGTAEAGVVGDRREINRPCEGLKGGNLPFRSRDSARRRKPVDSLPIICDNVCRI